MKFADPNLTNLILAAGTFLGALTGFIALFKRQSKQHSEVKDKIKEVSDKVDGSGNVKVIPPGTS